MIRDRLNAGIWQDRDSAPSFQANRNVQTLTESMKYLLLVLNRLHCLRAFYNSQQKRWTASKAQHNKKGVWIAPKRRATTKVLKSTLWCCKTSSPRLGATYFLSLPVPQYTFPTEAIVAPKQETIMGSRVSIMNREQ
jgi:hypothetical protein